MSDLERIERKLDRILALLEKPQAPAAKTKRQPRMTRLPADWQPSEKLLAYCRDKRPDLDPARTFNDFRDYYLSHGKTMADWDLTAMRWVRNEKRHAPGRAARESPAERRDREAREALEALGFDPG